MENADSLPRSDGKNRVGEASLYWRREGRGPCVVLLHGFPLSGHTWRKVVALLRERFTCYMPDLVGLGQSQSAADGDYSSQGQARVLRALFSELGIDSYALVGNDTGGWIARELALIDKPRISRLILTNTEIPFHRPPWIPMYQVLAHLPGFGALIRRLLRSRAFRRSRLVFGGCFQDLNLCDGEFQTQFVEPLILSGDQAENALRFLRQMKFSRLDEFERLHRQLTMPTLFIWGENDPTFPETRARTMVGQFPNVVDFHRIGAAKLFVYEEHPKQVAELVTDFLLDPLDGSSERAASAGARLAIPGSR